MNSMTKELSTTLKSIDLENIQGYRVDSKQLFLQINLDDHSILIPYIDKMMLLQDLIELKTYHLKRNETMSQAKSYKLKQLFDENRINTDYFFRFIFSTCLLVIIIGGITSFQFLLEPLKLYLSLGFMAGVTSMLLFSKKAMNKKWDKELKLAENRVLDNFNNSYHQNNVIIKDLEMNISCLNMEIKNGIDCVAQTKNQDELLHFSIGLSQFLDNNDAIPIVNEPLEEEKRKKLTR